MKLFILSKIFSLLKSWKRPYFDFSQLGEEKVILNKIQRIASNYKFNQCYIDIGGFNPILLSNTYKLYQKNWCGLIIEPNKNKLKDWNKIRPRDFLINSALVDKNYEQKKIKIYYNQINSADETAYPDNKNLKLDYFESNVIKLHEVFEICEKKFSKPFFLNIDIEGKENDILPELKSIDYKIPLICVELFLDMKNNQLTVFDYRKQKSVIILEEMGYYLVSVCGPSLIFCHKDLWIPFAKL